MARWGALRTWWIRNPDIGLKAFPGGSQAGESIAAIKVLLGLSLLANFYSRRAENSISDIEQITGLSRPMVVKGITSLEKKGMLSVSRGGYRNEYEILDAADDEKWAKVPYELLRKNLPDTSNRGAVVLAALKIYLLLAAYRPNKSASLSFSHEKIRSLTGIQTRHVRRGIDVLLNHGLIKLSVQEGVGGSENYDGRHNVYTLLGISVSDG